MQLNRGAVARHRPGEPSDEGTNVTFRYAYDPNGNLVQVTLPPNAAHASRFTFYEYDPLNRLIAETDPVSSTWSYEYDGVGNLTQRVDANGHVTTYTYYPDDQLRRTAYDDGTAVSYTYDANNNCTAMTDTLGATTWAYLAGSGSQGPSIASPCQRSPK